MSAPPTPAGRTPGKASWKQKLVVTLILGGLAAGLAYGVYQVRRSGVEVEKAAVGTCLEKSSDTDVAVVDCDDPAAEFTVVGRQENKSSVAASVYPCPGVDNVDSTVFVSRRSRVGGESDKGVVLCLSKVKK